MPSQRLFIALPLPEPLRTVLAQLCTSIPHIRWTPPEQLHVTLRFLGDIDSSRIPTMVERLSTIHVEPFLLPLEGVGSFPPKAPPRVLWVGLGNGHPRLHQLRKQIDDALLNLGIEFDVRTFHPHVTLGRCDDEPGPEVTKWLRAHEKFEGPSFRVDAFDLVSSELRPSGAIHRVVEHIPITIGSSA